MMKILVFILVFVLSNLLILGNHLINTPILGQVLIGMLYMGLVAFFTQWIAHKYLNPVKSSALIGLILGVFLQLDIQAQILQLSVFTVAFGATFVGMCSSKYLSPRGVFVAGVLYGFAAIYTLPYTSFIGGAMGTLACLCCLVVINILKIIQWKRGI